MPDPRFFKQPSPLTIEEIAKIGDCKLHNNDNNIKIAGVAPITNASENDLTFLSNVKYADQLMASKACACVLDEKHVEKAPDAMVLLVSENPYASYAKIAAKLYNSEAAESKISENAFISGSAKIADDCTIEPSVVIKDGAEVGSGSFIASNSYIDSGVKIGNNCHIGHNVTLSHTIIGDNVIIHPGVRIGQDGFGFASHHGVHIKVPQLGRVIIEDDVEIGANSCIDRGAGPDTVIGQGTKIDNLVQIGHNVQTGKGCIIVSQVGVSGSTKLKDYVVLGGQVGVAGHLEIGNMVNVAAQSGVAQDIPDGAIMGGSPAVPIKKWHRQTIALKRLIENKGKK